MKFIPERVSLYPEPFLLRLQLKLNQFLYGIWFEIIILENDHAL